MAFRRSRNRNFRSGRPRRAPLARKRRTWVSAIRSGCEYLTVMWDPPVESCSQQVKWVLLDNALLESGFSDRATVRRIIGDLWITPQPDYGIFATPEALYTELSVFGNAFIHMGLLRKPLGRDSFGALGTPNYIPIASDFDHSEAEWLKTWQHLWQPVDGANFHIANVANGAAGRFPVGTDDTHTYLVPGTPACNELATGSGFICIETEHSVDCEECPQPFGLESETLDVALPKKWHVHLDVKKRIPMREDQELYLHLDWNQGLGSAPTANNWMLNLYGSVKLLLEY